MEKLAQSLDRLAQEDPTFRVAVRMAETGQTLVSGMGELASRDHYRPAASRVRSAGQCRTATSCIQGNDYTACGVGSQSYQADRGSGAFAVVTLRVSPGETGSGFQFIDSIKGGVVPKEFVAAVEQGCCEAAESGPLGGYPTVDICVELVDGQTHDVDSSERAFKIAGSMGIREALETGDPTLLEPVMV